MRSTGRKIDGVALPLIPYHTAIGGDTDGQGGAINAPLEIDTVADYQKVADVMATRGYTTEDIENVMWRNWQRFFEANLPA